MPELSGRKLHLVKKALAVAWRVSNECPKARFDRTRT